MSQYFTELYERFGRNIKVELDRFNYATKSDLIVAIEVDTSILAAKSDSARLKAALDKIDLDELKTVPIDLSNLSIVVNNDIVTTYGSNVWCKDERKEIWWQIRCFWIHEKLWLSKKVATLEIKAKLMTE